MALRGDPRVSVETRRRVEAAAEELGYRPNPLVAALMRQKRERSYRKLNLTIGLVTNHAAPSPWKQWLMYPDLVAGANQRADERGYRVEEFWLGDPGMSGARLSQILAWRNVPGVIFCSLPMPGEVSDFDFSRLACVTLGYSLETPRLHRITSNHRQGMHEAMDRARAFGYRRIGLVISREADERVVHLWSGSFLSKQLQFPEPERLPIFLFPESNFDQKSFSRWRRKWRPDIVIGSQGEFLSEALAAAGASVPKQTAIISLFHRPDLQDRYASIDHNAGVIGAALVDFVVDLLNRNDRGTPAFPETRIFDTIWRDGWSLPRKEIGKANAAVLSNCGIEIK